MKLRCKVSIKLKQKKQRQIKFKDIITKNKKKNY